MQSYAALSKYDFARLTYPQGPDHETYISSFRPSLCSVHVIKMHWTRHQKLEYSPPNTKSLQVGLSPAAAAVRKGRANQHI